MVVDTELAGRLNFVRILEKDSLTKGEKKVVSGLGN